ncbi:MAG TPA: hypothetical protein VFQ34_00625 [Nitrospiraceae bacterium]|jgi:hypothetical protein|nr:hypothetical protein [Nitrospiraceae bacterium]
MPVYFLIGLTLLVIAISVWASVTEEGDETTAFGEYEPQWEPFEDQQEYRKAG